jgi:hypothetical protein
LGYTLRLPYPPEAKFMRLHAESIVAKAAQIDNKTLDFSVESLRWVDATLFEFHEDGVQASDVAESLFRFGAYIGEVFIQNNPGTQWVNAPESGPFAGGWPLVSMGPDELVNPIGKAFKRVEIGVGEDLLYFYDVFTKGRAAT